MGNSGSATRNHSFEFFPAKTDQGHARLLQTVTRLGVLAPEFVSVTFGAGGSTRDRSFDTVTEISKVTGQAVVPHLSCVGSTEVDLQSMLRRYREVGVERIMALRGDAPTEAPAGKQSFEFANQLVGFIREHFPNFRISVACYPEYHPESASPQADLDNFARKVEAGADEAISQYFFSNEAYYRFREDAHKRGVSIPIVPGLMPMTDFKQIERFSAFCGAGIPLWLRKRMEELDGDRAGQSEFGIEVATRQAEDLLRNGAPALHFYTLNKAAPTEQIYGNLGLRPADR